MTNDRSQAGQDEHRLGIVCGIAIIAVLAGTLWPFNPFPRNGVRWLPGGNGIAFDGAGLVMSKTPLKAPEAAAGQSCTLELLLRPGGTASLYTILSFYKPDNPTQFVVKQWTDGVLVTHDAVDAEGRVKRSKFDVDHAFQLGKLLLITIVSGADGTVVYTNGRNSQVFPKFTISPSDLSGQIVMGTSPVEYRPWIGEVRGLAVYSRGLTPAEVLAHYKQWTEGLTVSPADLHQPIALYSFTEHTGREIHNTVLSGPDLEIPKSFSVPHKAMLASPVKEFERSWNYGKDLLLNIAGFVPVGLLVCAYFALARSRGKAILYSVLAGGMLSIVIELLQAYIPQRVSGTTDIITNTLGAAIGAGLARPGLVRMILGRTTD